ncbi:hypothetical protein K469DRAFT_503254, partial [Zopfia rhizophila CBS 207.26]
LSHSWGIQGHSFATTLQNMQQRKQHIAASPLLQTFKDAVIFTRWLGIRYLWSDSLCIIQEDTQGWGRESSAMVDIYENSHFTLALTKASCDADGLF